MARPHGAEIKNPGSRPGFRDIKKPRAVSLLTGEGNRLRSGVLLFSAQADRGFLPVIHHHQFILKKTPDLMVSEGNQKYPRLSRVRRASFPVR